MRLGEKNEQLGSKVSEELSGGPAIVRQVLKVWLPGEIQVALPCLGDLTMRPLVLDRDAAWLSNVRGSSYETTWIECCGMSGALLVERGFVSHIVNTLIGRESALASDGLSRIERGLFEGALAGLGARLHLPPEVRLGVAGPAPTSEEIMIEVLLTLGKVSGRAWMCVSPEFLLRYLEMHSAGSGADGREFRVELGRTRVPCADLNIVDPGDLVVFDEVRALFEEDDWAVRLHRGDASAEGRLCPDGALRFAQTIGSETKSERTTLEEGRGRCGEVGQAGEERIECNEVAAEIGCVYLAALTAHIRGQTLFVERAHRILMRRNGVPWAEGNLDTYEDAMAVRITRLTVG